MLQARFLAHLRRAGRFGLCGVVVVAASASPATGMVYSAPGIAPRDGTTAQATVLRVAVSTPIFADIVARVGGERTAVNSVLPPNADPHTYEATPRDIAGVSSSDTFIYMGNYLEAFIEAGAWRRAVQDVGIPELKLADRLDLIAVDVVIDHVDHDHDLRQGDPHAWLDPYQVIAMVGVIETHLAGLDPTGAEAYRANAAAYQEELASLDREIRAGVERIPPERRKLVVFHDAYRYFAGRYGFEVIGYVLRSPGREPSARELAELLEVVRTAGVDVVFKEPQLNAAILERLAADSGVAVGELLTDNFAGRVDTYADLMRFNLASLVAHLAPDASDSVTAAALR